MTAQLQIDWTAHQPYTETTITEFQTIEMDSGHELSQALRRLRSVTGDTRVTFYKKGIEGQRSGRMLAYPKHVKVNGIPPKRKHTIKVAELVTALHGKGYCTLTINGDVQLTHQRESTHVRSERTPCIP